MTNNEQNLTQDWLKDIIKKTEKTSSKKTTKIRISKLDDKGNKTDEFEEIAVEGKAANSIFLEYRDKKEIAQEIASATVSNGYKAPIAQKSKENDNSVRLESIDSIEKVGKLFYLSNVNKVTGLLSVCPSVVSLINACYTMMDDGSLDWKANHKYDNQINSALSYILDKIYQKTSDNWYENYLFDATPYINDYAFTHDVSYLDTITWVIVALQTARTYAIKTDEAQRLNLKKYVFKDNTDMDVEVKELTHKEILQQIDDGILACVRMVTDMAIDVEKDGKLVCKGWSFTNVKASDAIDTEPSLYFSYAASTVYLGLYKDFQKYIDLFRKLENENLNKFLPENLKKNYWNHFDEVKKAKDEYERKIELSNNDNDLENDYIITDEERALFDEIDEIEIEKGDNPSVDWLNIDFFMNRINNGHSINDYDNADDAYYLKLHRQCLDTAEGYWNKYKDNLGDYFVYPNGNIVDENAIRNSGASNELFNGLFVCGIILNSAYDNKLCETNSNEKDRLIDTLQACLQKTQRYYDNLERNEEAYKVSTYTLQFIEKDTANAELGKLLRKSGIKVCTLIPMLLKTNSLISEYVIQYPQRQMRTHLVSIMKNRMPATNRNGSYQWCWESDGFSSISNYYYIDAINAFYKYYDKYEKQYIKLDEEISNKLLDSIVFQNNVKAKIEKIVDIDRNKAHINEEKYKQENADLKQEKDNLEQEKKALQEKYDRLESDSELGIKILKAIDDHMSMQTEELVDKIIDKVLNMLMSSDEKASEVSAKIISILQNSFYDRFNKKELENKICVGIGYSNIDKFGTSVDINKEFKKQYLLAIEKVISDTALAAAIERMKEEKEI